MSVGNFMKCNVYFCTLVLRKIFVFILAFFFVRQYSNFSITSFYLVFFLVCLCFQLYIAKLFYLFMTCACSLL